MTNDARARADRLPLLIFAILFLGALGTLIACGDRSDALQGVVVAVVLGPFCWLTARMTAPAAPARRDGRWFGLQIAACAAIVAFTGIWLGLSAGLHDALALYMEEWLANGIRNFVVFDVPIACVLLALGVSATSLGLGRFRFGWLKTAILWLILPLAAFAFLLASGRATIGNFGASWLSNLLQNGVSEEFLWRGVVFGRLRAWWGNAWGLFAQALLFGAWHYHTDLIQSHGNLAVTLGAIVANQAIFGYAMGFLTLRTGNVATSSAFHLLFDSLGEFFS